MKRYIYGMSFVKSEALRRASFYSQDILEHVIKVVLYKDIRSDDVDHWVGEIASWLRSADTITLKPNNRHLKPKEVRDTVFQCMGDSLEDYLQSLNMFQHDNKKSKFTYNDKTSYPEIVPDAQTADKLMCICTEMMKNVIPMICDKQSHSRQEYQSVLENIISLQC